MHSQRILAGLLALLLVAAIPHEEPGAIFQDSVDGVWEQVAASAGPPAGYTWNFSQGKLQIYHQGNPTVNYTYKVDSSRSPSIIQMGPYAGIIAVDGDTMKLCIAYKSAALPTDFKAKGGEWSYGFKRGRR